MPILNNYLNITEVAELLDIHPGTVKRLCREGKLAGEKVHNGWLIQEEMPLVVVRLTNSLKWWGLVSF